MNISEQQLEANMNWQESQEWMEEAQLAEVVTYPVSKSVKVSKLNGSDKTLVEHYQSEVIK